MTWLFLSNQKKKYDLKNIYSVFFFFSFQLIKISMKWLASSAHTCRHMTIKEMNDIQKVNIINRFENMLLLMINQHIWVFFFLLQFNNARMFRPWFENLDSLTQTTLDSDSEHKILFFFIFKTMYDWNKWIYNGNCWNSWQKE